jgi:hypothetical protein
MAEVKYAISIKDGRLVFATAEVASNPTFFVLHPDTVLAIQKGKLSAAEVLVFIKNRPRTAEEIARLKPENVRQTELPKPEPAVTSEEGIKIPVQTVTEQVGPVTESTVEAATAAGASTAGQSGEKGVVGIPSKDELAAMKVEAIRAVAAAAGKDVSGMNKSQMIDALAGAAV